jgi:hypothetical protein
LVFTGASRVDTVAIGASTRRCGSPRRAEVSRVPIREAIYRMLQESPRPRSAAQIRRGLSASGPSMVDAMLSDLTSAGRVVGIGGKYTTLARALGTVSLDTIGDEIDTLVRWTDRPIHVDLVRQWLNAALGLVLPWTAWLAIVRQLAPTKGWFIAGRFVRRAPLPYATLDELVREHLDPRLQIRDIVALAACDALPSHRTRRRSLPTLVGKLRAAR